MSDHPNILMILVDEMRGDAMGVAGHPDVKTPHPDTLASQGVYFDRAYSVCPPSCIAARATLMTSMIPAHTGRVGKMHAHPLRSPLGCYNIELSDHGMDRKSLSYEGSAHIPMILYGSEKWIGPPGCMASISGGDRACSSSSPRPINMSGFPGRCASSTSAWI